MKYVLGAALSLVMSVSAQAAPGDVPGRGSLPDGRGWEMVSPADKNATDVIAQYGFTRSSADGNAATFASNGAFADAGGLVGYGVYLARRDSGGWSTRSITPEQHQIGKLTALLAVQGFSDDLEQSVLMAADLEPSGQSSTARLWLRNNATGAREFLTPIGTPLPAPVATNFAPGVLVGADDAFRRIVFESSLKLTPDAPIDIPDGQGASGTNVYESMDGQLRLVSILPDGTVPASGAYSGSRNIHGGGAAAGQYTQGMNVVSDDGARIFWTDASTGQLYVRVNGTSTVHVSASQRAVPDPDGTQPATFSYATPDGSKVFFRSSEKLTDDSTADATDGSADLYSYDLDTGALVDVSVSSTASGTAQTAGVVGVSDDGATVYFVAFGNLADGSSVVPDVGPGGSPRPKLYVAHDGEIRYLATLATMFEAGGEGAAWASSPSEVGPPKEAHVSANGRYLLIKTVARLTRQGDGLFASGAAQLYRFDSQAPAAGPICVSCPANDDDPAAIAHATPRAGVFLSTAAPVLPNALLTDGRVVFDTATALEASDRNGKVDAYIWAPTGGARLLSSGKSRYDSYFLDARRDGRDVFFATRESLTVNDRDANVDVYDARVDGGFPEPPEPSPSCEGDVCQGAPGATARAPGVTSLDLGSSDGAGRRQPRPLMVSAKKVLRATAFRVTVRVTGRGRVRAYGRTVATTRLRAERAGTYRVRLTLTKKARHKLARKGSLVAVVRVRFVQASGAVSVKAIRVTLKRPSRRQRTSDRANRAATALSIDTRNGR